jgi:type IX secretion system PorP/SprF family membrane protein
MKRLFCIVYIFIDILVINAQNEKINQEYLYNSSVLSPALSGYYEKPNLSLIYRTSWLGIQGAPEFIKLNYDMLLPLDIGFTSSIMNYKIGIFSDIIVNTGAALRIMVAPQHYINFGINLDYQRSSINTFKAKSQDLTDPVLKEIALDVDGNKINAGFGLVYNWDDLYAGINMYNLFKKPIKIGSYTYPIYRQFEFFSTYRYSEIEDWDFDGFLLISKIKETKFRYEIAAKATYNKNIWFGLNWRRPYNFGINLGGKLTENIYFNYTFVLSGQKGLINSAGSHEIALGYRQKKGGWLNDRRKGSSRLIEKIKSLYNWVF